MSEQHCLNCDTTIVEAARFCLSCGQRTDTARLSLHDVRRDMMHSFVNIERGPLAFAKALLVRPGTVAREFVEGKRRRYYGPFATLAVLVGLASVLMNMTNYHVLAHDGLGSTPAELLQRHFNLLLLAQLPLLGFALALVFRSAGLSLAEHMVLAAYALSVRAVLLILVVPFALVTSALEPGRGLVIAFWAAWYVYVGWAASQFYVGSRIWSWLGGSVAAGIAHAAVMLILYAASDLYSWGINFK